MRSPEETRCSEVAMPSARKAFLLEPGKSRQLDAALASCAPVIHRFGRSLETSLYITIKNMTNRKSSPTCTKRSLTVMLRSRRSPPSMARSRMRSEEHTSELQSLAYLVCRLLLEKKNHLQST